jgi:quinol-cytochrome oxidoreductase complex cytochrome b subunit
MTDAQGGTRVNWSKLVRQLHRWLSITFAVMVVANFALMGQGQIAYIVGGLTLLPLFLLLFSGLYMFALPYVTKWRAARQAAE